MMLKIEGKYTFKLKIIAFMIGMLFVSFFCGKMVSASVVAQGQSVITTVEVSDDAIKATGIIDPGKTGWVTVMLLNPSYSGSGAVEQYISYFKLEQLNVNGNGQFLFDIKMVDDIPNSNIQSGLYTLRIISNSFNVKNVLTKNFYYANYQRRNDVVQSMKNSKNNDDVLSVLNTYEKDFQISLENGYGKIRYDDDKLYVLGEILKGVNEITKTSDVKMSYINAVNKVYDIIPIERVNGADTTDKMYNALTKYSVELALNSSVLARLQNTYTSCLSGMINHSYKPFKLKSEIVTAFNHEMAKYEFSTMANITQTATLLDIYKDIVGFSLGESSDYSGLRLNYKEIVRNSMIGKQYTSIENILSVFNQSVAAQKYAQQAEDITNSFNGATSKEVILDLLKVSTNQEFSGINLNTCFNSLNHTLQLEVANTIYNAKTVKTFANLVELKNMFDINTAIIAVNNSTWDTIETTLVANNFVIGLNMSGSYATLTQTEKSVLFKTMKNNSSFSSISEIVIAYNNALNSIIQARQDKGGGGTGSTGSGTTIKVTPNIPLVQPPKVDAFVDTNSVEWAKDSIEILASKGIISGFEDGTFRPNQDVTKEEFIKMVILALGNVDESADCDFTDVDQNSWYYPYVASAKKAGIIMGVDSFTFGAGQRMTREEMSTIIYRAFKLNDVKIEDNSDKQFSDEQDISNYAVEAIQVMVQIGIINGMEDKSFKPKQTATRAMTAKVLYGVLSMKQ